MSERERERERKKETIVLVLIATLINSAGSRPFNRSHMFVILPVFQIEMKMDRNSRRDYLII